MMVETRQLVAHSLTVDLATDVVKAGGAIYLQQEHAQPVADLRQRQGRCHLLTPVGFPVELSRRVTPLDWSPSRVENWRAHLRWRVSNPTLSLVGWVHSSPIATFPAPASSNAACGFPALRFPACFMFRVMGPIALGALSAAADSPGSC